MLNVSQTVNILSGVRSQSLSKRDRQYMSTGAGAIAPTVAAVGGCDTPFIAAGDTPATAAVNTCGCAAAPPAV